MNRLSFLPIALVALTSAASIACGGSTDSGIPNGTQNPTNPGPGGTGTGAPPASASGTTTPPTSSTSNPTDPNCTALVDDGAPVSAAMTASAPPAPMGGPVPDGTYHTSSITLYTGPGGPSGVLPIALSGTLTIHGNIAEVAITKIQGDGPPATHGKGMLTFSGTTATYTPICGGDPNKPPLPSPSQYSGGGTLTLFQPNDLGQMAALTFSP